MSPQQLATAVENNFTKGLVTEATGLNFPENAATDTDNCEYTLVGDVLRRLGVDKEVNGILTTIDRTGKAINGYKWNNVGGDGTTQFVVTQVGSTLYFWNATTANTIVPLSATLVTSLSLTPFVATGGSFDVTKSCDFTDGNGYLFVYHPSCDPIYVNYSAGVTTGNVIAIRTRDLLGYTDDISVTTRPATSTITAWHYYNVLNQGWTTVGSWAALSTSTNVTGTGSKAFTVAAGLTITPGDLCSSQYSSGAGYTSWSGTVSSYAGTTLTINITSFTGTVQFATWGIVSTNTATLGTWVGSQGNYPSNADQWWRFKNTSNVFDPTVQVNIPLSAAPVPRGHFILYEFNQDRNAVSGSGAGLPKVLTTARPTTGTWFQGRIWYTGANASQQGSAQFPFYSWSEKIYFSQVLLSGSTNFGDCFQVNDPTSDEFFDILPTDGGVIHIQGSGAIHKLFSTQNGLLVFAANGVWFITGSQGIGFAANDYTITRLSNIRSISNTSFVDVMGLPYFWNEEGIYHVQAQQNGSLSVESITIGTIQSFYDQIPLSSKKNARAAYDPIEYVIRWVYKDTEASSTTDAFAYDRILNYSVYNKAFFPYSFSITNASINGLVYVAGPGGSNTPEPTIKYISSTGTSMTFADLHDDDHVDWASVSSSSYDSYFITGYKVRGQAIRMFQPQYIQVWSRLGDQAGGYGIQGIWDYASNQGSGKYGSLENVETPTDAQFGTYKRRHKMRGHGYALQFKITSLNDKPFDVIGWSIVDTINQGT